MNQIIELHDSKISDITLEYGAAKVIFSHAYIHRSQGRPGIDAGTGWSQRAELMIEAATVTDLPSAWPCKVYDGVLEFADMEWKNLIPIPLEEKGRIKLTLDIADGDDKFGSIEIHGECAKLTLIGEAGYLEEFRV
jgi:hypothetical protein